MSGSTLFRKSSLDSISSPEQLNDYIKVSNPSIWLVLAALFILLSAVLVWGFTCRLPTTVGVEGVVSDGNVLCYVGVEDTKKISIGQKASLINSDDLQFIGKITSIGDIPMSAAGIASELNNDYLAHELVQGEFGVKLIIVLDKSGLANGTLLDISIVTDSVRPVDFLLG